MKWLFVLLILLYSFSIGQQNAYWDTTDAALKLHMLFEDEKTDQKGHVITTIGTVNTYANGYGTGKRALYRTIGGGTAYLYVAAAAAGDLDLGKTDSSLTVQVLCKFEDAADMAEYHYFIFKRAGTRGWVASTNYTNDSFDSFVGDGTNSAQKNSGADHIDGGVWTMLTYVFKADVDSVLWYRDGVYKGGASFSNVTLTPASSSNAVLFRASSTLYTRGWIDELAIYGDVRTSSEIAADWQLVLDSITPTGKLDRTSGRRALKKYKQFIKF